MSSRVRGFRASFAPAGATSSSGGLRGLFVVPLLGLALSACSDNSTDTPPASPDMTPVVTTAYDDMFVGPWGIKAKVASIQTLPFFGDKGSTNTVISVATFRKDAVSGKLVMDQQECRITVASEVATITTDVPDAIADTTPIVTGNIQVTGGPGTLNFSRDQVALGIGCHLANPFTDALPTDMTDARIFDQDGDTKLGVTVKPQTPVQGEVYVVQRRKYSYVNGAEQSATRYTGSIVDRSEQYILDANNTNLKSQVVSKPVDATSVFEMVKLNSQYPCTQLRTEADTLFTLK